MKKREFNKIINSISIKSKTGRKICVKKAAELADEVKNAIANFIIRNRGPVIAELMPSTMDQSWLASMGYLYRTTGKESGLTFYHTAEHRIK